MRHLEDEICCALFQWYELKYRQFSGLLIHIPNGGKRDAREGGRFKKMGVRAGVSDYFLAVPVAPYHGFWIEVKTPKGKPSQSQLEFLEQAETMGYKTAVVYGINQAAEAIEEYLDGLNERKQAVKS